MAKFDILIYISHEFVTMLTKVLQNPTRILVVYLRAMCNELILSFLDVLLDAIYRIVISPFIALLEL